MTEATVRSRVGPVARLAAGMAIGLLAACGGGGPTSAGSVASESVKSEVASSGPGSSASSSGDLSAVHDAIASQMAPRTSPAAGLCVADKSTAQLGLEDLEAIGVTSAGVNSSKLIPLSLDLNESTIPFWDAVFECIPADVSTLYAGPDQSVVSCIQDTVVKDKYLRLAFVIGTKNGSSPSPLYEDLGQKLDTALRACGVTAG